MAKFCMHCGSPLTDSSYKFCPECGKPIAGQQAAQAAPQRIAARPSIRQTTRPAPQSGYHAPNAQRPAAYPGAVTKHKKARPGLGRLNALLALLAIALLILLIRFVPEKLQARSAPDSPFEENVLEEQVRADYETLRAGGTLLGGAEEAADEETPYYNDYSWMADGEDGK